MICRLKKNYCFRPKTGCAAFSLIEVLMVMTILSVIGLTLYAVFSNGVNIWQRMNQETPVDDLNIFFDKIAYDLRNSFDFSSIKFKGSRTSMAFPALIKVQDKEQIGRVEYYFNRKTKTLNRAQSSFSEVYENKTGSERALVGNIGFLSFQYYGYDTNKEEYFWADTWQEEDITFEQGTEIKTPLAVLIEIEIKKDDYEQKYTKKISIPFSHYVSPRKDQK